MLIFLLVLFSLAYSFRAASSELERQPAVQLFSFLPVMMHQIEVTPPQPPVQIINAPAFDTCLVPTLEQMQTWWDASPYRIAGLYLGGIQYASGCTLADAAWIWGAREQGWAFIPTWVGPQAPCSDFKHKMSEDPAISYLEGRAEADLALTAAISVGLSISDTGYTILYYDLEGFGGASDECRQAAGAFINGWVERLHELGQRAGAYGSACASYPRDWVSLSNVPDNLWVGSWYTETYDANASVFGMPCLSDSLWSEHQRIRQYAGGHNESWGGESLRIDSDIADGEVATPTFEDALPKISTTLGTQYIHPSAIFTGDGIIQGEAGRASGPGAPVTLGKAFFLDESLVWKIIRGAQGELLLDKSENSGEAWSTRLLPVPAGDWYPIQITFSDTQDGWIVLQHVSRSIFSRGILLKTVDGGETWEVLNLPAAGTITFVNDEGWLTGGVTGNERYHSLDAGRTWQRINPEE